MFRVITEDKKDKTTSVYTFENTKELNSFIYSLDLKKYKVWVMA